MGWDLLSALFDCCRRKKRMWRVFYDDTTGRAVSMGSVWVDQLPPGIAFKEYGAPADLSAQMWNEATRDFIARPPKVLVDRLQEILTNPAYPDFQTLWAALNATRRQQLTNALARLLGKARYRSAGGSLTIEE